MEEFKLQKDAPRDAHDYGLQWNKKWLLLILKYLLSRIGGKKPLSGASTSDSGRENGLQTSAVVTKSVWVKPSSLLTARNKYFSCMTALSVQPVLLQYRLVRSSFPARLLSFREERRRSQFRFEQRPVKCDWWCGDRSSQEQENALPAPWSGYV